MKIAVLGSNTLALQTVRLFSEQREDLALRCSLELELIGVGVTSGVAELPSDIEAKLFTEDIEQLIEQADVVVEVLLGEQVAKHWVLHAISLGKTVVTANKAMLAQNFAELVRAAQDNNTELYYEATVCAAVPIVNSLHEILKSDRIESIKGIVNGSVNYILEQMLQHQISYEEAEQKAQYLGFSSADESLSDADDLSEAVILSCLAFQTPITVADIDLTSIRNITLDDINMAKEKGYALKLLYVATRCGGENENGVYISVRPSLLPLSHPLAAVQSIHNAVMIDTEPSGRLMFYGQGAGTSVAPAIIGDVIRASVNKAHAIVRKEIGLYPEVDIVDDSYSSGHFYINMSVVEDKPGVLASIAGTCAKNGVSIDSFIQEQGHVDVRLLIYTHEVVYSDMKQTIADFKDQDEVANINSVLYLETS